MSNNLEDSGMTLEEYTRAAKFDLRFSADYVDFFFDGSVENILNCIHKSSFMATSITLFAIALLAVFGRTVVRYRYQNQLLLDDVFLFFGVLCLCAAFGLLTQFVDDMYMYKAFIGGRWVYVPDEEFQWLLGKKISDAYFALTFTTLFFVKLSFLLFFRILIRRVHKMTIYWWTVLAITMIAWPVSIVAAAAPSYPAFGASSTKDWDKGGPSRVRGLVALATILDIATDILLLIIPFHIIWQIRIDARQKLILSSTLGLSVFMIIIAIIRISKVVAENLLSGDIIWIIFWQQIEACTAVIMVSLSAFRPFFVTRESRARDDQRRHRKWYMSRKNRVASALRRKKLRNESGEEMIQLPIIPRATMTGMSTYIKMTGGTEFTDARHHQSAPLGGESIGSENQN